MTHAVAPRDWLEETQIKGRSLVVLKSFQGAWIGLVSNVEECRQNFYCKYTNE